MLGGRLALFFALVVGLAATQMPEFVQQYRQRLGGAIDELATIVAQFEAASAREGMNAGQAVARLEANGDPLARHTGTAMGDAIARLRRLRAQQAQIDAASPAGRYLVLLADFDRAIAVGAYGMYQPAVPITLESFVLGLIGFVAGGGLVRALHWPFRAARRRRRALQAVTA
jgi:hypothetical protein